jgi:WD40 repeat protein
MAFSPDGETLAISSYESVMLLDIASGSTRPLDMYFNGTGDGGFHFSFSADGSTLAVWDPDQVSIWDLSSGQKRADIDFPEGGLEQIIMVALSPDGSFLATGTDRGDNILILWDPENGSILRTLLKHPIYDSEGEIPNFLAFSPDGKGLILGTENQDIGYLLRTWELP